MRFLWDSWFWEKYRYLKDTGFEYRTEFEYFDGYITYVHFNKSLNMTVMIGLTSNETTDL